MLDLDALQATAEAADNWGKWAIWEDLHDGGFVHVGNVDGVIPPGEIATPDDVEPNPIAQCYTREIADHVAAANPAVVLALIAELRQAREVIKKAREARSNHPACDRYADEDVVSCGWKNAVLDIDAALSTYEGNQT